MIIYPLCIAWNIDIDADFIAIIQQECETRQLPLLLITLGNLRHISYKILRQEIAFDVFLDRASDTDIAFIPMVYWTRDRIRYRINPYETAIGTCDKAAMHHQLARRNISTPATLVLPAWNTSVDPPYFDLSSLGTPFVVKPARGRGGEGVELGVSTKKHVQALRQAVPDEAFLVQRFVIPAQLNDRPAWFRIVYCTGTTYLCWWEPETHRYSPVTADEVQRHHLHALETLTQRIAAVCKLDMFSTEIALTEQGEFFVIDYVNDQIDLRMQSKFFDGLPDVIVHDIAHRIIQLVEENAR